MIPRRALSLWETMQTLQKTHILLYEKIQKSRVSLVKPGMRGANKRGFLKKKASGSTVLYFCLCCSDLGTATVLDLVLDLEPNY